MLMGGSSIRDTSCEWIQAIVDDYLTGFYREENQFLYFGGLGRITFYSISHSEGL